MKKIIKEALKKLIFFLYERDLCDDLADWYSFNRYWELIPEVFEIPDELIQKHTEESMKEMENFFEEAAKEAQESLDRQIEIIKKRKKSILWKSIYKVRGFIDEIKFFIVRRKFINQLYMECREEEYEKLCDEGYYYALKENIANYNISMDKIIAKNKELKSLTEQGDLENDHGLKRLQRLNKAIDKYLTKTRGD